MTAYALIEYFGAIGQHAVSAVAGGGREITHGGQKVGIAVAKFLQGGIVLAGHAFLDFHRYFIQKIVGKDTAPVRGVYGGKGSNVWRGAAGAYGIAAVQTALGMCDDIYPFTAGFPHDGEDALCKLLTAVCHGGGRLLAAVAPFCFRAWGILPQ